MEITQGSKGDFGYDVKFEDGKLKATMSDAKVGIENVTTIDGIMVINAVIDLIEKAIPGDQTAQAKWLKDVAQKELAKQAVKANVAPEDTPVIESKTQVQG